MKIIEQKGFKVTTTVAVGKGDQMINKIKEETQQTDDIWNGCMAECYG